MQINSIKTFHIKAFGISVLAYRYGNGLGWIRLFGVGLFWRTTKKYDLSFSERNGYKKYKIIGNWIVNYLPKN